MGNKQTQPAAPQTQMGNKQTQPATPRTQMGSNQSAGQRNPIQPVPSQPKHQAPEAQLEQLLLTNPKYKQIKSFMEANQNLSFEQVFSTVVEERKEYLAVKMYKDHDWQDINAPNLGERTNCSPLQLAIQNNLSKLALLILEHPDIDPNIGEIAQEGTGIVVRNTPLVASLIRNQLDVVDALLAHPNLDLDLRFKEVENPGGWSPLLVAHKSKCGLPMIERFMQFSKVDVNARDSDGQTLLLIACRTGNRPLFDLLLQDNRVDVNLPDNAGHSPLFFACRFNRDDFVMSLLDHPDIEINHENEKKAPLFIACANKHVDIITILIRHGADPSYLPETYSHIYEEYLVWRQAKSARTAQF